MNLAFTEEQAAVRDLAARIFDAHCTRERLKEVESGPGRFDRALWAELARAGLLGAGLPEEHGGTGGGMLATCALLEEAGAAVAPVPLLASLVLGASALAASENADHARLVRAAIAGDAVLTGALAEPGSDDPLQPATCATPDGGVWRLDGDKTSVPHAEAAAAIVVAAHTDAGAALFVVDPADAGVSMQAQRSTGGEPLALVRLDGAHAEALGGGEAAVIALHDRALTGMCAIAAGVAARALRMTADHLKSREQFGRPLGAFQAVQQRLADAYIDAQAMRWTMWQAAWRLDEGVPASEHVAVAKFWAADGGHRVLAAAQHLHGGLGVDLDYGLFRYTFAAKQIEMTLGGATRQLARLGDLMAGAR